MKLQLTFLLAALASAFAAEETPEQLRAKIFRTRSLQGDDSDGGAPPPAEDCPPPVEQCDFCGGPIANPQAVAISSTPGVPAIVCGTANSDVASLACTFGSSVQEACLFAISEGIEDICCVAPPDESPTESPPGPSSPSESGKGKKGKGKKGKKGKGKKGKN